MKPPRPPVIPFPNHYGPSADSDKHERQAQHSGDAGLMDRGIVRFDVPRHGIEKCDLQTVRYQRDIPESVLQNSARIALDHLEKTGPRLAELACHQLFALEPWV